MAYNVRKIQPEDLEGRKIIGVKLPFGGVYSVENPDGYGSRKRSRRPRSVIFVPTYQTKDAVRTNLLNYFLTGRGERYLNVTFGNDLIRQLFEHDTEAERKAIVESTKQDLRTWFPRVQVLQLEVYPASENAIQLYLRYAIRETNTIDELTINLEQ